MILRLNGISKLNDSELVEESFCLKKESENLLELAKRAVEVAIEEGEEKAIESLNNK